MVVLLEGSAREVVEEDNAFVEADRGNDDDEDEDDNEAAETAAAVLDTSKSA